MPVVRSCHRFATPPQQVMWCCHGMGFMSLSFCMRINYLKFFNLLIPDQILFQALCVSL